MKNNEVIGTNGRKVFLGDVVEHDGENNYFVVYRYGEVMIKQVGTIFSIVIKDFSEVKKMNVMGSGNDWLIIAMDDDPIYEKVKHLI